MSSITARNPPSTLVARRETYLSQKSSAPPDTTSASPLTLSPIVRHIEEDASVEDFPADFPVIDQNYASSSSSLSLVRRK